MMKFVRAFHWASLVAQMVKRLPTMWEIWVQSLGSGTTGEQLWGYHSDVFLGM